MPFPLIPLIALAGTALSGWLAHRGQKKANEQNKKAAATEAATNLENWNRANAYNDPSQQMARLQGANLNPRLVYGQSSGAASGNATDVKGYSREDNKSTMEGMSGFQDIAQSIQHQVQTDNVKAQTKVAEQDKLLRMQDILKRGVDTANATQDLKLKKGLEANNLEFMEHSVREQTAKANQAETQDTISSKSKQDQIDTYAQKLKHAIAQTTGQKQQNLINAVIFEMNSSGISFSDSYFVRQMHKMGIDVNSLIDKYKGLTPYKH